MPDWLQPALGPIGLLLGAVVTFFGVRYTARSSARAAARTADVASRQVDVDEWQAILAALREEIRDLRQRVGHLEEQRDTDRANIRQLLAFARGLIAIVYRLAPDHPIPTPPSAFVDELAYITERPRA
ncbi:hypothetical protein [Frigoribacterium sp. MCBA15_019]|uniref:hypothetical protein n=1 Tax=Frigoribacterium sp. MCBA15_019 TaxID=1898745 RepID=UPI0008DE07F6|nr:hypothetical protein [Frigoribacterium sp. MCBA15_019]OII27564.1 hypothetical protein BIV04_03240 [Frigoribacterium sp. MCBA15_019]